MSYVAAKQHIISNEGFEFFPRENSLRLDEDCKASCEGILMLKCVQDNGIKYAPGSDGFPAKFYKVFGMTSLLSLWIPPTVPFKRGNYTRPKHKRYFLFFRKKKKTSSPKELEANNSFKLRIQNRIGGDRKSNETTRTVF